MLITADHHPCVGGESGIEPGMEKKILTNLSVFKMIKSSPIKLICNELFIFLTIYNSVGLTADQLHTTILSVLVVRRPPPFHVVC